MRKLLLLAGVAWATSGCSAPRGEERDFGKRPDWCLTGPNGSRICAADFDRKVVIVDFWATWCPPCRREVADLIELQAKYKNQGLAILGLSFDRDKDIHDQWVRANQLNYPSVFVDTEEGRAEVAKFERLIGPLEGFPTTLVIRRDGLIVYKHVGYASSEEFERILRSLL